MQIPTTFRSAIRLLATASLLMVCSAATAGAQWTRHHPSRCQPERSEELGIYMIGAGGGTTDRDTYRVTLICPGYDTSEQPDSLITEVRVYVSDNSPVEGFRVRACRSERDTAHGVCSDAVTTGNAFMGETVLTLTASHLSVWSTIDFGYLEVVLPKNRGNEWSYFKGWVTER